MKARSGHTIDLDEKLTARQWQIVCRFTDIQSEVAETWRDLVTNGEVEYLASHLRRLRTQVHTLEAIVRSEAEA